MLPVARHWYEIEQLDEGLFRIWEPHVVSFMQSNMFVVRGSKRTLLVDGGNGVVPLKPFLHAHGLEPDIVLATHAHADHIGALSEWPEIMVHASEAQGLADLDPNVTLAAKDYDIFDMTTLMTGDPTLTGPMITALPRAGYGPGDFRLEAPQVQPIEEGHVIELGGRSFEILHVPGHCPGELSLWDFESGALIAGDAIYDDDPLDTLLHSSPNHYRRSLARLMALKPRITHGGHGASMNFERLRGIIESYLAKPAQDDLPGKLKA